MTSNPPRTLHGDAIICERIGYGAATHIYAYEDDRIARQVPAGYFIEWWPQDNAARAGYLDGDYARGAGPGGTARLLWFDWYSALCWCRHEARRGRAA